MPEPISTAALSYLIVTPLVSAAGTVLALAYYRATRFYRRRDKQQSDEIAVLRYYGRSAYDAPVANETPNADGELAVLQEVKIEVEPSDLEKVLNTVRVGATDIILVSRCRTHEHLAEDEHERLNGFATNEQEAFDQLLELSGLDEVEIANERLTMERLQGPAGLIEALKPLVPDSTFDMEVVKISLPLPPNVARRLNP